MIKLTYEKNGEEKTYQTTSYYEAAVRKNKLMKQGLKVKYEDTGPKPPIVMTSHDLSEKGHELIDHFIKNVKLPKYKSDKWDELEQDW